MRPLGVCLALCLWASVVQSSEPTLRAVNIRGLQVGGTTRITIDGDDLGKAPKLLLPFPVKQTLLPKSTEKRAVFDVALDGSIEPGYYNLRVATEGGVSLPVIIGVDGLPQEPVGKEAESHLPVALHGSATGSSIAESRFLGKAGQKVMVEVEAKRFGSALRPVVHLYSPKKLQVAWSWPKPTLLGDTRLEATLPEDGTYTVAIHDAEYAGANPGFFRLRIGQWHYADRVFPPIVSPTTKSVELIGNSAVRIALPARRDPSTPLAWPRTPGGPWSGPRPHVEMSTRPELTPGDDALAAMFKVGSFAIWDRLTKPFEEVKFRVPVAPGSKVRFEVFAERLGSPLDVALVIRDGKGNQLARAEDGPGTLDPVLEYPVPANVTIAHVGIVDTQGRAVPGGLVRLAVDPVSGIRPPPEFHLATPTQRMVILPGGSWVMPVFVDRKGFSGKINLAPSGLPASVKVEGASIEADASGALVVLTRPGADPSLAAITRWQGRGGGLARPVFLKGHPLENLQPWLATEVAMAGASGQKGRFTVDWRGLPATAAAIPGRKLALPVKVARPDPASPVRLTILSSQSPPLVNNQPDPNRAIRAERPIEIGAKKSDGEIVALLPAELPANAYEFAIQAEFLSTDKRRVLATAFTPVKRLSVRMPIAVKLATPSGISVKLDPKKAVNVEIRGEVARSEGFTGEATVTITGLPPGIAAPRFQVKAGATAFTLKLSIPPGTAAAETRGILLSATGATDPKRPNIRVKSREVELSLTLSK